MLKEIWVQMKFGEVFLNPITTQIKRFGGFYDLKKSNVNLKTAYTFKKSSIKLKL